MTSDEYDSLTVAAAREMRKLWKHPDLSDENKELACHGVWCLWFTLTDGYQKDKDNAVLERFGRLGPDWVKCNL